MANQVRSLEEINALLAELSVQILPPGLRLYYARVAEVREQDINAQSMPKAMFDQLVANIIAVGGLESVPLCVLTEVDGKRDIRIILMISGHHRLRAVRTAGQEYILILLYDELSASRIKSKQLAHNSIAGTSDPELVKRIWDQITDVQARFEAFIDPRSFGDLKPVSFKPVDVDMQGLSKTVLLVFLPTQAVDFDAAVEALMPSVEVDAVYLANKSQYDGFIAALKRVRSDMEIVSAPTAMAEMARLALERLDQLTEETDGTLSDQG